MNLYNLLRLLIKSGAQTGGLTKVQAYDALNLVDRLEAVNGFGHILRITYGQHKFSPPSGVNHMIPANQGGVNYSLCGLCEKGYNDHVSG